MRKFVCAILFLVMMLSCTGCGESSVQLTPGVGYVEILLNDTDVLQLQLPNELSIIKRDNNHYWELTENVGIYRMVSTVTTAKLDEASGLYVSDTSVIRNFDDCCVVINCSKDHIAFFKQVLSSAKVVTKNTKLYKELSMEFLPAYDKAEMFLEGNMYMPDGCESVIYDVYDAKLFTQGTDWLQCYIADYKLENLKPRLMTLALLGSGQENVTGWYESKDIFYCYSGNCIVGAKKLAFNSWYVYYGSPSMINYILTGINAVHG